jgi:hypothetical protein
MAARDFSPAVVRMDGGRERALRAARPCRLQGPAGGTARESFSACTLAGTGLAPTFREGPGRLEPEPRGLYLNVRKFRALTL